MAYSRDYNARINWENFPSTNTAVDADNLNKMDYAIFEHDKKVVELDGRVELVEESVSEDVAQAKEYSDLSKDYALESKAFSEVSSDEANRAYSEAERARMYADTVQEGITTTTSRTLTESQNGGIRIISMDGESQQNGTPTPEAPIDIESVEISEIGTHGKNFATKENVTVNASSTFDSSIGTIDLKLGDKITVSCKQNDAMTSNTRNTFWYKVGSGSKQYQSTSNNANLSSGTKKWTITATEDATYTIGYWCNTPNVAVTYSEWQIEKGSVATDFDEFKQTKITLSSPITLRGIGDVKDVLCKQNGVYGVLRRFPEYIFSGTETLSLQSAGYVVLDSSHLPYPSAKTNRVYCTHFRNVSASELPTCDYGVYLGGSLNFRHKDFSTVDEYKNFFSNNDVKCVYESTPTFEPLPLADQIALHKLESFGGVTYLFTDSTIEPIIEVEYGTSKVGGYALKGMNTADANALMIEQLTTLTNELATQIVAGSEA